MARSKKVLPPVVRLINEQRREILDLKRKFRDLRWENRSLRVRLDAEIVYRERYLGMHDSNDPAHSAAPPSRNRSAA